MCIYVHIHTLFPIMVISGKEYVSAVFPKFYTDHTLYFLTNKKEKRISIFLTNKKGRN